MHPGQSGARCAAGANGDTAMNATALSHRLGRISLAAAASGLMLVSGALPVAAADAAPHMVRNIKSGPGSSKPSDLTAIGNLLYFTAGDGAYGRELWRSDGTRAGTRMVAD